MLVTLCGCERKIQKLRHLEGTAIAAITKALWLYEGLYPGVAITNLPQAFNGAFELDAWHRMHPAFLEKEFRKFGKYAGFTNSFYEKYVRVPAGITNRAFPKDVIYMNAHPVPDYDGKFGRYVIWREGPQSYNNNWAPEEQIQEAFRRAGVPIPRPSPMPKPRVPKDSPYPQQSLGKRMTLFFRDLAGDYGPGRRFGETLMLICLGVPTIAGVVMVFWFARRPKR